MAPGGPYRRARALAAFGLLLSATRSEARVVFTGYADFAATTQSELRIRGPASVLRSVPEGRFISRGFSARTLGLFATTQIGADSLFTMDLSQGAIGASVGETLVRYAYLETRPADGWSARFGKITLPVGFFNSRRFYPFHRAEVTPPVFQSAILGLPIADVGVLAAREFDLGAAALSVEAYAVNGYQNNAQSTSTLRSPTLVGGLTLRSNLRSANNNKEPSGGLSAVVSRPGVGDVGATIYGGAWDPQGKNAIVLGDVFVHWTPGGLDLLVEYLELHARGDEGLVPNLGSTAWTTRGGFLTLDHPLLRMGTREVRGFARIESYWTQGTAGAGDEALRGAGAGLNAWFSRNCLAKAEIQWLEYRMPFIGNKDLYLDGFLAALSLTVTF